MTENLRPAIRFTEYTGDWEQRKLGDIILDYSLKNPENEELPVLTSSRQGIQKQEDHFGSEQKHDTTDYIQSLIRFSFNLFIYK